MMSSTSVDLSIEPAGPLSDAVEKSGPFGGVCGPLVLGAKKKCMAVLAFFQIHFLVHQLREPAHV